MSLKTIHVNATEINEGIAALDKLKHLEVRGNTGAIATNLHLLRKAMQDLIERRKVLDEIHIRTDLDGEKVPASRPEIDVERYVGVYSPEREYMPGAIVLYKDVFHEVEEKVRGVEPPNDETYVAVGKVSPGFLVKNGLAYQHDVQALEAEKIEIRIRTVPIGRLEETKGITAACYWMEMLEDEPETVKTNGHA